MSTKTVATGISRIEVEAPRTSGYMVRIMRGGKMHQEFLSDKKFGGKRKALAAATERRAELVETLPEAASGKGRKTNRNHTGKVGVHVGHDVDARWSGCEYWYYVASWLGEDQKRVNVKFSWNRYGEPLAWRLACIARDNELRDREQILKLHEKQIARRKLKRKAK
jgi:hypothetical protein